MKQVVAAYLVGDGLISTVRPGSMARLWARVGPRWFRRSMRWFERHPETGRALAMTQAALFFWIGLRQTNSARR